MPEEHSRFGYSAVSTFKQCPYRYKLTYIDNLKTIPSDDANNALAIGTAMHKGIEVDADTAIAEYFAGYPIITDKHVDEEIKLRHWIPIVKQMLPKGGIHELTVKQGLFIGTLDYLVPISENVYDLYDFKYSNNVDRYMESAQLDLYKHYFEQTHPHKRIRNMYLVFIPKIQIRQKKTEELYQFRNRLRAELEKKEVRIVRIIPDASKVIQFNRDVGAIIECKDFPKNTTRLCDWCQFNKFCNEGDTNDMLPSTNRVAMSNNTQKKIWIYGAPFSGKTTLADGAPTPLNLNTDGNVKSVTMPRLPIKDTMDGRQKKLAWEVFKDAIDDLEAGSDFKTIVVDLLEDTYESCRLYMYKKLGIEHESDDTFRAWDKVRTEYLSTLRRLVNLPYNIILISHEDTSKDITKKSGDKVTAIKPNINDKVANKVAGMVDIVIRAVKEDDNYLLSTKTSSVVFGGGRLNNLKAVDIPNSWDSVEDMYASAYGKAAAPAPAPVQKPAEPDPIPAESTAQYEVPEPAPAEPEAPVRRTRRVRQ